MAIESTTAISSSDVIVCQSNAWISAGVIHGFTGKKLNFNAQNFGSSWSYLKKSFSLTSLYLPHQVHGNSIWDLRSHAFNNTEIVRGGNADAVIADRGYGKGIALGVVTADCVPLIVCSDKMVAVIHAGWRGLAAGIIQEVVKLFPTDSALEVLIGPCAGNTRYEVGNDVVTALMPFTVTATIDRKTILDLQATAIRILQSADRTINIATLPYCTISDVRFYSVRREGASTGRNLTFIMI